MMLPFQKVEKFIFSSKSLEGSKMMWNHKGIGRVKKEIRENKVYYLETLYLENNYKSNDAKIWEFTSKYVNFYRYRNKGYELIFSFKKKGNIFKLRKVYLCGLDNYSGKLKVNKKSINFVIYIKSDRKNEEIRYTYF